MGAGTPRAGIPCAVHAGRYGQQAGGMHPTGMHSCFNMNSKHLSKCQFALKVIPFSTVSNLVLLEVVQKCPCCQLCVLRENLNHQSSTSS